jgi:hypothetical protein
MQEFDDEQLEHKMVFDDEGFKDDESDLDEEDLIKRIVSQPKASI